jgi:hypothetical protein
MTYHLQLTALYLFHTFYNTEETVYEVIKVIVSYWYFWELQIRGL